MGLRGLHNLATSKRSKMSEQNTRRKYSRSKADFDCTAENRRRRTSTRASIGEAGFPNSLQASTSQGPRTARSSDQISLSRTPDQSTRQDLQQRQTNQLRQSSEPSHQTVTSALDDCTVCLDHVGTNGGRKTLPCDHTFCRGCIDRWQSESRSCPLCRDNGSERAADTVQPLSQATGREEDNEHLQEVQQPTTLSRISRSLDLVAQPSEEVRGLPSVQQQASPVHLRADHESSGSQVSHRAAVVSGNTESFPGRRVPVDCGICLEDNGEYGGLETLRCSHTFCRDCISQWLRRNSRCPYRCELDRSAETNSVTSQPAS
jgi:hypothetical protein